MEYSEQVFSIAQNALLQQINKRISSNNKNIELNESDLSKDTSTNVCFFVFILFLKFFNF